ncbi:MAG: amidophosphoribosyltransferase [Armatimonadota bacterium]|nr:amidophosphoribosyltransferase [Armatimonadota bacterium]MDR7472603.1 amidophosphoribosyltransferase [Armatimonadota bacterium]MDR7510111.1 amidophosphoribosyltransferase [Armatimonadota bacterium]MDR7589083.1 amidophosphoribosyltransferase [Armatimonadota bacterium]MDR7612878.1 amidophosphoribosyltransferase [Armatimonadota bacterium]
MSGLLRRPAGAARVRREMVEECGVFGIVGGRAAAAVYAGLLALQHRGQESAGIATGDGTRLWCDRGMGLVSAVFDPGRLDHLPGQAGIGHVRYSTMGSVSPANAQPLVVPSPWGPLALAHNGHLINAVHLRGELERAGARLAGTTDSELIAHLVARAPAASVEDAVAWAMARLVGAFTVVMLAGGRVLAFRDAHAIRPLVLGTTGAAWVVASETCALSAVGAAAVREVDPGELVILDGGEPRSRQALPADRPAHCVFEYIYFARPDSVLAGRTVHLVRRQMGRVLAREHPADADVVVPVPDSGTSAAMGYAEAAGLPLEVGLVKNRYSGRTFIRPDPRARAQAVRGALAALPEVLRGRRVVLVDDSIVRGTTSAALVHLLRNAGAREVHVRISSPPIRFPCYYGVDTTSRGQLVAAAHSVEQIRQVIGADSLGYLSQPGLVEALRLPPRRLCMACLDGRYPTPVPAGTRADRDALEAQEVAPWPTR